LNPASKSDVVGAVSDVEPALIWSRTTRPAVMLTLPGWPQLAGLPLAVHCAFAFNATAAMSPTDPSKCKTLITDARL
jgi:hypothetical protein